MTEQNKNNLEKKFIYTKAIACSPEDKEYLEKLKASKKLLQIRSLAGINSHILNLYKTKNDFHKKNS